jgi:hypothetical protein
MSTRQKILLAISVTTCAAFIGGAIWLGVTRGRTTALSVDPGSMSCRFITAFGVRPQSVPSRQIGREDAWSS